MVDAEGDFLVAHQMAFYVADGVFFRAAEDDVGIFACGGSGIVANGSDKLGGGILDGVGVEFNCACI